MSLIPALVLLTLFAVSGPAQAADSITRYEASHEAMGTIFTVAAYGRDADFLAETVNEVFEEIDRLDAQMSNYKQQSELSRINREAAGQNVMVEPKLFQLIQEALRFGQESGGAFDITVGPLMRSWGFFRGRGRMPSPAEIKADLRRIGYRHVKLDADRRTIHFDEPGIELDLGGIAKGYAVDQAVAILRENGVTSALVSSGSSSIYALGAPPEQKGWRIVLRDPFEETRGADVLTLKNYSVSTSGSYIKFFTLGDRVYSHIMDPHTGMPVENMLSTAVLAPRTTDSDALSTALYVLGVEASRNYVAKHSNIEALFYLPSGSKSKFTRLIIRSPSYSLPPDRLAEIQK